MTLATDGLNMLFSFGKKRRRLAGMGMAFGQYAKGESSC